MPAGVHAAASWRMLLAIHLGTPGRIRVRPVHSMSHDPEFGDMS